MAGGAVAELIDALADDPQVRREAIEVLRWLGSEAGPSVPLLVNLALKDTDRVLAARAILRIDPTGVGTAEAVKDEASRKSLISLLRSLGIEARRFRVDLESQWARAN